MPSKTLNLFYRGPQPHRFIVGRKTEKDTVGNVRVTDPGREITLIPAVRLPADKQHQPVDAADWETAKKHRTFGPIIADLVKRGDLVEYPAA